MVEIKLRRRKMSFIKQDIEKLEGNVFNEIGNEWMLVTAEKDGKVNTMTASWGGEGVLWNQNVAFVFIRPQRYTYEFTESSEYMTLSFFGGEYKKELSYLGSHSGRDEDKITKTGLHVEYVDSHPTFSEAAKVLVCRKLYSDMIKEDCFTDKSMLSCYEKKDFHRMYVVKVEAVYTKE